MQTDLMPSVHGLNILSAMNDIPGSFIHAIQIRKGPGSVSNGYEAITGQINIELLKPIDAKKLFVNVYGSYNLSIISALEPEVVPYTTFPLVKK